MRNKQSTFLAGVAAVALFAATGAFAQQGQLDQKGGAGMNAPTGTQTQRSDQGAKDRGAMSGQETQGKPGQGAAAETGTSKGGIAAGEKSPSLGNRNAQELNRNNRGSSTANRAAQGRNERRTAAQSENAQSKSAQSENGRFNARSENRNRRGTSTAQRNEPPKGLQANTKLPMQGANVTLNERQRTQIRDTIVNGRGAPRVGSVDFNVTVGTVIPRGRLHLVRVPETLVRIDPAWRGFLYFVYNDEIIIVDPHDMRIINVLPV
jgi:hypothetical protein